MRRILDNELKAYTFYPAAPGIHGTSATKADATRIDDEKAMKELSRRALEELHGNNQFKIINPVAPLVRKRKRQKTA